MSEVNEVNEMNEVNEVYIHNTAAPSAALAKPEHVASLATSCVTVTTHIKVWSASQQDQGVSDEITAQKSADSDSGKFVKNLLAGDQDHKEILKLRQQIYNMVKRHTYDWAGTTRILPVVNLPRFHTEFDDLRDKFNLAVDKFIGDYQTKVSNMAFKLGTMFDPLDYPTAEQVRTKFSVGMYVSEVPQGDFRCTISQDLAQDLHDHYQRESTRMVQEIHSQQRNDLLSVLRSISHSCDVDVIEEAGVTKVKRRKLFDSTFERAKTTAEVLSQFNPVGDNTLTEAGAALAAALDGKSVESIRNSDHQRDLLKAEVDSILSKF